MRVNISSIKGQLGASKEVSYSIEGTSLDWGEGVKVLKPLSVQATITNTRRCYLVRGTLSTVLELQCDRCLKPFQWKLEAPLEEEFFAQSEARTDSQQEETNLFAEESTFTGDTIDLSESVREQAVLALPYKCLCSENCAGLCSICGQDLNTGKCGCERVSLDPRLAGLARLLENEPKDDNHSK